MPLSKIHDCSMQPFSHNTTSRHHNASLVVLDISWINITSTPITYIKVNNPKCSLHDRRYLAEGIELTDL
jgi:hypothetical protein